MKITRLWLIPIVALLIVLPACGRDKAPTSLTQTSPPITSPTPSSTSSPLSLKVESAGPAWGDKFFTGLSNRTVVQGGMLFDCAETVTVSFQMRDTLVPLSIAFISADGVIRDIQNMEPLSRQLYVPSSPYRYALEVNQGYFAQNGVAVGDTVDFQTADSPDEMVILFFRLK